VGRLAGALRPDGDGPPPWNFEPNYSVTLTSQIPVVMHRDGKRVFERMRWGIVPNYHKGTLAEWVKLRRSTYNTRDDNVEKSGLWKRIWRCHRCLIPVSGFYEWHWKDPNDKKERPQPYYFMSADGSPAVTIAGIFDRWSDPENGGRDLLSCSMMTTEPNDAARPFHDRLVLTLTPDQYDAWLDGSAGMEMVKPPPNDRLKFWPVSKRINSVKVDPSDKSLTDPIEFPAPSDLLSTR